MRDSLATHLGRQSDDVWGLLLLALGVVAALGIYADLTGPVGHFIRDLAGLLFGWGRLALPLAIAGVGFASAARSATSRAGPRRHRRGVPAHVDDGAHAPVPRHAEVDGSRPTSSATPAASSVPFVGEPLRGLLAVPGAALILGTIGVVGLLVLTRTSARDAWGHIATRLQEDAQCPERLGPRTSPPRPRPKSTSASTQRVAIRLRPDHHDQRRGAHRRGRSADVETEPEP